MASYLNVGTSRLSFAEFGLPDAQPGDVLPAGVPGERLLFLGACGAIVEITESPDAPEDTAPARKKRST